MKRIIDWFRSQYTISRLRIKAGDILIVTLKGGLKLGSDCRGIGSILRTLEKRNIKDTQVMFVDSDCDLQSLSEEEMNKAGWFRIERVSHAKSQRSQRGQMSDIEITTMKDKYKHLALQAKRDQLIKQLWIVFNEMLSLVGSDGYTVEDSDLWAKVTGHTAIQKQFEVKP